ncbi:MAG: hypothetical protein VB106_09740 [Clostridiaceae bacterium]|nr:hypothetical protein [Clostridiaceae bacterium]
MDGLFIIIAIVIAVFNFAAKQQQNQNRGQRGMNRRQGQYRQKPVQGPLADLGKSWNEMFGKPEEYAPSPVFEESEGSEAEDRRRTGSLDYMEQSSSSEGICDEHPHELSKEIEAAHDIAAMEDEEDIFDLTEENLLRSIVMAEVLGPPRAMKRKIR